VKNVKIKERENWREFIWKDILLDNDNNVFASKGGNEMGSVGRGVHRWRLIIVGLSSTWLSFWWCLTTCNCGWLGGEMFLFVFIPTGEARWFAHTCDLLYQNNSREASKATSLIVFYTHGISLLKLLFLRNLLTFFFKFVNEVTKV